MGYIIIASVKMLKRKLPLQNLARKEVYYCPICVKFYFGAEKTCNELMRHRLVSIRDAEFIRNLM